MSNSQRTNEIKQNRQNTQNNDSSYISTTHNQNKGPNDDQKLEQKKLFMSRADIMNSMFFPVNNNNLVIIPSNIKGTGFLRTCYDPQYLKNLISEQEFLEVIDQSSKIVAQMYTKKRLADTAGINPKKEILIVLSLIFACIFFILIYLAIKWDDLIMEIISYIILLMSFSITIPLALYECMRQSDKQIVSFNGLVKKELDLYFSKINNQKYESRGLEWYVDEGHYYIELRIYHETKENIIKTDLNLETKERFLQTDQNDANIFENVYPKGSIEPEREDDLNSNQQNEKLLKNNIKIKNNQVHQLYEDYEKSDESDNEDSVRDNYKASNQLLNQIQKKRKESNEVVY